MTFSCCRDGTRGLAWTRHDGVFLALTFSMPGRSALKRYAPRTHLFYSPLEEAEEGVHYGVVNKSGDSTLKTCDIAKHGWVGFHSKGAVHQKYFKQFMAAVKHPQRSHFWFKWRNIAMV